MEVRVVNLNDKFNAFTDHWSPKIVGELNGQQVKLARFSGEFVPHKHDNEDEMFLVVEGTLLMELHDGTLTVNPGEFVIIPRGTTHKPVAIGEVKVMLFEPSTTLNTGDATSSLTTTKLDRI
jgi:mannose-6-phosphate isomerase-like protein (cupin superfamily)